VYIYGKAAALAIEEVEGLSEDFSEDKQ